MREVGEHPVVRQLIRCGEREPGGVGVPVDVVGLHRVEPLGAAQVEPALERTGGTIVTVADDAILEAWRLLAQEEGLFCEPASAAGVAGLAQAGLAPRTRVVCAVTGHGLKDPEAADRLTPPPVAVDPDPDAIAAAV
jgi:threonine synthase